MSDLSDAIALGFKQSLLLEMPNNIVNSYVARAARLTADAISDSDTDFDRKAFYAAAGFDDSGFAIRQETP